MIGTLDPELVEGADRQRSHVPFIGKTAAANKYVGQWDTAGQTAEWQGNRYTSLSPLNFYYLGIVMPGRGTAFHEITWLPTRRWAVHSIGWLFGGPTAEAPQHAVIGLQ